MILTGKAKKDFLQWNEDNDAPLSTYAIREGLIDGAVLNSVIIDFFDSIGLWAGVVNDTLILDKDYFNKGSWQSNIELLIITARDIYNENSK